MNEWKKEKMKQQHKDNTKRQQHVGNISTIFERERSDYYYWVSLRALDKDRKREAVERGVVALIFVLGGW